MYSPSLQRANLDLIKSKFAPGTLITPSYLRLEVSVNGTFDTIKWNTTVNQGTTLATEKRLNIADCFAVEDVALFIAKAGSSTTPTAAQLSQEILSTYANPAIFTGSGEAANLQAVYNGYLSLRVQQTVFIDSFDTKNFEYVPQSQEGTVSSSYGFVNAASADTVSSSTIARDGVTPETSFKSLTPMLILNGQKNIDWSMTLPASTNLTGTSSSNQVILFVRGWLIQGGVAAYKG